MKSLYIDNSGDIEFDSKMDLKMVDAIDEIKQRLKIELLTNKGEWFLNTNFGIPWIELLSENQAIERYKREISKVLNGDEDVTKVREINLDYDRNNRHLNIYFTVIIDDEIYSESVVIA